MQHNQVFVIQVSSGTKPPLALPAPPEALLPSEVKYSASLVRGLGCTHLVLGAVIFLLGVLGTWVEPETCWAGAGVWTGLTALCCGLSGLVAHCLWYKNFSIKAFLVTSVVCVVLSVLAIILSIYAIINRHQHFQKLMDQIDQHRWFQPYDLNKEHRLTLSISVNLLVGFFLELALALWSTKVGWRGVHAPEFSASKRDNDLEEQRSMVSPSRPGQQVPLAALYQLLQAHPELLGNKTMGNGLAPIWATGLEEHPSHHSMDYQERVSRFLSHAIEDQNHSLSRSLSALQSDHRDGSSPTTSTMGSGGRGSPTDTLPIHADQTKTGKQLKEVKEVMQSNSHHDKKPKHHNPDGLNHRRGSETKVKAPAPKLSVKAKSTEDSKVSDKIKNTTVSSESENAKVKDKADEKQCHENKKNETKCKQSPSKVETVNQKEASPSPATTDANPHRNTASPATTDANPHRNTASPATPDANPHRNTANTAEIKVKECKIEETKTHKKPEITSEETTAGRPAKVPEDDKANASSKTEDTPVTASKKEDISVEQEENVVDLLALVKELEPPCEFQDT